MKGSPNRRDVRSTKTRTLFAISILLPLLILYPGSNGQALAQDEAQVTDEHIQESLKTRLEKALEENPPQAKLKRAWVGALQSIANNTLTIETREGPKLASVSGETTFVRLPKRTAIEKEDLAIGEHTIAMGTLNGNKVLSTTRVLSYESPPLPSDRQALFATAVRFDAQNHTLTYTTASGAAAAASLTDETIVTVTHESALREATPQDIVEGSRAILLLKTTQEEGEPPQLTLLRLHLLSLL